LPGGAKAPYHAATLMIDPARHIRFGFWLLLISLSLGIVLEGLLGFRIGWYVDVGYEARRLMLRLAHTHGTLLAFVNIAVGLTARAFDRFTIHKPVSHALIWAAILLPLGFLLGGLVIYDGDPGLGILLTPVGAILLIYAIAAFVYSIPRGKKK
jgi:membrane protein DedA with SNARE-associated domain